MIWFRAAAACLLLIAIPAVLLIKDRYKGLGKTPSPIPVATSSGREHTTLKDERSAPTAVPAVTAPSHPTVSRDPTLASHLPDLRAPGTSALTRTPALSAHGSSGQPAHPIMTRPGLNKLLTHGADTLTLVFTRPDLSKPITVTAAAPLKKEQRVVHINELEPQQPTPATVKGPRQKPGSLRIGLGPEESYRPATSYIEPETHSILNLKHAQNP